MNNEKFFCCCESCGSLAWSNGESSNSLEEGGELLEHERFFDYYPDEVIFYCHECEKPVEPITFDRVNKRERKKIYNMNEKTRANWVKSFRILDKLEENNESNKKF